MACDLSFIEGVLKVPGSHVHFKSGIISEMVTRDVVTTGLSNSSNCDDLVCTSRTYVDCKLFQMGCFVVARFLLPSVSHGPSTIPQIPVQNGSLP